MPKATKNPAQAMMGVLRRQTRPVLRIIAKQKFESAKERLLEKYLEHPITREIASHNESSGFLNGVGSLFGFIGFDYSDDPISELYFFLKENVRFVENGFTNRGLFSSTVYLPTKDALGALKPLEWTDVPWPVLVEEGISGLPYFLSGLNKNSRSFEGIQANRVIRGMEYSPPNGGYLSQIFANFRKDLLLS